MPEVKDLVELVKSRNPIIVVESNEETRAEQLFMRVAEQTVQPLYRWTVTQGLSSTRHRRKENDSYVEPHELLRYIWNLRYPGLYLLLDFHPFISDPRHVRMIKDIALQAAKQRQTLIFLSHRFPLPDELVPYAAKFELKLPDESTLNDIVMEAAREWSRQNGGAKLQVNREAYQLLLKNLSGLSASEVRKLTHSALQDQAITAEDIPEVARAKYELLNQDNVLYFESHTEQLSEVGGLRRLKEWLVGTSGSLDQEILLHELQSTQPLSRLMSEKIDDMRNWASDRTVSAH